MPEKDNEIYIWNKFKETCPFCHKVVAFSWVRTHGNLEGDSISKNMKESFKNKNGNWAMAECPSCENVILVKMDFVSGFMAEFYKNKTFPPLQPNPTDTRIPDEIRKDIDEAKLCFSVSAWRACAVIGRRAMQSICIEQGAKNGNLVAQISELKGDKITTQMAEWATSIRWVGDDAAHPGKEEVTPDQALGILNLAEQMANIIYVMPAISKETAKGHERG